MDSKCFWLLQYVYYTKRPLWCIWGEDVKNSSGATSHPLKEVNIIIMLTQVLTDTPSLWSEQPPIPCKNWKKFASAGFKFTEKLFTASYVDCQCNAEPCKDNVCVLFIINSINLCGQNCYPTVTIIISHIRFSGGFLKRHRDTEKADLVWSNGTYLTYFVMQIDNCTKFEKRICKPMHHYKRVNELYEKYLSPTPPC